MKRIKILGTILLSTFLGIQIVQAAPTVSTSVSTSTIETGSKVTFNVTIRSVASWNIKINGYGSTSNCSSAIADATSNGNNATKTFSLTCKGTDIGLISFSVTGDATSQDGANIKINSSNRVNVTAVRPKSSNNYLKSIKIGDYTLNPVFNKDTLEYKVTVPSTANSINLEAAVEDGTASISGTGEHEVNEGINTFEIKVNAQNGAERIYKVLVTVEDTNPIKITAGGKEYTIVKNAKGITKPDLFEETKIKINDIEIPAYINSATEYTLIAVKDETGKVIFVIYDAKNNSYTLYQEMKSTSSVLNILTPQKDLEGYLKTKLTIDNQEYEAFKVQTTSSFAIVFAMNMENGKKDFYVYDIDAKTFQRYDDEMMKKINQEKQTFQYVIYGFASLSILLIIILTIVLVRKSKKPNFIKNDNDVTEKPIKEEKGIEVKKIEISKDGNLEEEMFLEEKPKRSKILILNFILVIVYLGYITYYFVTNVSTLDHITFFQLSIPFVCFYPHIVIIGLGFFASLIGVITRKSWIILLSFLLYVGGACFFPIYIYYTIPFLLFGLIGYFCQRSLNKNELTEEISDEKEILTKNEKEITLKEEEFTKSEALKKVDDATKIIEEYEKTIRMSKEELQLAKKKKEEEEKKQAEIEETMFDIMETKKKSKKKKSK